MGKAKEIIVKVIPSKIGNAFIAKNHYSGKFVNNSKLHFGCFLNGDLHGVMSFGCPLDKRKVLPLVHTGVGIPCLWNEMLELNRMAFDDALPKNSESRCLSIAFKLIKKNAPHIKWILSFADGAQCGDGAIYRASGFVLTSIKKNNQIWEAPDNTRVTRIVATDTRRPMRQELMQKANRISRVTVTKSNHIKENGGASMKPFIDAGFKPIEGFQLRYIYLLDKSCHVAVPILPFSEIDKQNARMYKGEKPRATSIGSDATGHQSVEGSANLTVALH